MGTIYIKMQIINHLFLRKVFVFLVCLMSVYQLSAQGKFTLSGKITDSVTGEDLIGASIFIEGTGTGTVTNNYGFYSLTLPEGKHPISIRYIGYSVKVQEITLNKDLIYNIKLDPGQKMLEEVIVSTERSNRNLTSPAMSVEKLDVKQISGIPVLFGEKGCTQDYSASAWH